MADQRDTSAYDRQHGDHALKQVNMNTGMASCDDINDDPLAVIDKELLTAMANLNIHDARMSDEETQSDGSAGTDASVDRRQEISTILLEKLSETSDMNEGMELVS